MHARTKPSKEAGVNGLDVSGLESWAQHLHMITMSLTPSLPAAKQDFEAVDDEPGFEDFGEFGITFRLPEEDVGELEGVEVDDTPAQVRYMDIINGTVTRVENFGVFVDFEALGKKQSGLLHCSEMKAPRSKIDAPQVGGWGGGWMRSGTGDVGEPRCCRALVTAACLDFISACAVRSPLAFGCFGVGWISPSNLNATDFKASLICHP